jgi:hypothetical protein
MKITNIVFGLFFICTSHGLDAQDESFLTNGLVAFYPLNGNANDVSGNGNNGIAENTVAATNQFGQSNSALSFTGNSWVFIPYSSALATTNYTVSLMFNSQTSLQNICLVRSGAGPSPSDFYRGYEIATVDFNENFGFWEFDGLTDYGPGKCVLPVSLWKPNKWYCLTFTQGGTNAALLYVNGTLMASATNSPPYAPAQSSPIFIGSNASGSSDPTAIPFGFFEGVISDVRFYNRALSSTEVQQLYASESQAVVSLKLAVKPSFSNLFLGTNYQMQVSSDLNSWTNFGSPFAPTNTVMDSSYYFDTDLLGKLFFRLEMVP